MVASSASSSASAMLALLPAPACTTTSAPRFLYFLTISGVIAARVSTGSVSERTVIRMLPPCRSGTKLGPPPMVYPSLRSALHAQGDAHAAADAERREAFLGV